MVTENTWFYDTDAQRLYVWKTGGGNPGTVEASTSDNAIYGGGRQYITIDGLICRYASKSAIRLYYTSVKSHVTVQNCDMSYTGERGIYIDSSGADPISNVLLSANTVNHASISGIQLSGGSSDCSVTGNTVTNIDIYPQLPGVGLGINIYTIGAAGVKTVSNNTVSYTTSSGIEDTQSLGTIISGNNVDHTCTYLTDCGGIYSYGTVGGTISNNTLTGGNGYGIYLDDDDDGVIVDSNSVTGTGSELCGVLFHNTINCILRNNIITGTFVIGGVGGNIYMSLPTGRTGNVIYNNYINGVNSAGYGIFIPSSATNCGINIYNNTITLCSVGLFVDTYTAPLGNVKNNIFYDNGLHIDTGTGAQTSIDFNCYASGEFKWNGGADILFSAWKTATGYDGNSVNENLLLTGYTIPSNSPCRDTGITVPSVTTDIVGNRRKLVGLYDIGCYEIPDVCP
jgi:parallel beta-helix repeat protein